MFEMQYSENLSIHQLSPTEFLLKIANGNIYTNLLPQLYQFGWKKYMPIINDQAQHEILISGMDLECFQRHFFLLSPDAIESLSNIENF